MRILSKSVVSISTFGSFCERAAAVSGVGAEVAATFVSDVTAGLTASMTASAAASVSFAQLAAESRAERCGITPKSIEPLALVWLCESSG
eukprot:scaffold98819_cov29-Tisochrysis_lutea.AAC.4